MENKNVKKTYILLIAISIVLSTMFGGAAGFVAGSLSFGQMAGVDLREILTGKVVGDRANISNRIVEKVEEESSVIDVVERVSPAVVSIIVTKDLPKIERFNRSPFGSDFFRRFFGDDLEEYLNEQENNQSETEKLEVGGGSGFIVSADGYVVTNKHVTSDETAEYTVLMNDERKYKAAVLARDPLNDLAILKIDAQNLPVAELGDSDSVKVGQTVVAIGNALGEFRNTVSTGVISGLSRSVVAGGAGVGSEQLSGVFQTDASINPGNSGGPLLDIAGRVIGINTAIVQDAQGIGFAIPINTVKNSIESVRINGRIIRPWLGVRYVPVNAELAEANNLDVEHGALIVRGEDPTELAVIPGSPADKAGLEENDIILEMNGRKLDEKNTLADIIGRMKVGDEIKLKVLHDGNEKEISVKLEEMKL